MTDPNASTADGLRRALKDALDRGDDVLATELKARLDAVADRKETR